MISEYEFIIVGAGLSGSVFSSFLNKRGMKHLVLEKSKGLGGRIASRRLGDQTFDHGVSQFQLNADQELLLRKFFEEIDFTQSGSDFNWVTPATQAIKKILNPLNVKKDSKVINIKKANPFEILLESGEKMNAQNVVITAPAPQAIELLKNLDSLDLIELLKTVTYTKRIILFSNEVHPKMKFMTDGFSEANFELSDSEILSKTEAQGFETVKKWRYEKVKHGLTLNHWSRDGIHLIGDLFQGEKSDGVGAALQSAFSLATQLSLI